MAEAAHSSPVTRRSITNIWLIGPVEENIQGMKLPTYRQVLAVFFHHHNSLGKTIRDSSRFAVREAYKMWSMARIPTTIERNAIEKLENMFYQWQKLKKNINRRTETQIANETALSKDCDKLFDIAHADAMTMVTIAEDRAFLEDQRGPRIGYMGSVDVALAAKEDRKRERVKREEYLRLKEMERKRKYVTAVGDDELTSEEELTNDEFEITFEPTSSSKKNKQRPAPIITAELSSALDRADISNRKAVFLLAETAKSLKHDISSLAINPESIRTARMKFRKETAQAQKASFDPSVPLVLHWDGKMLPDITGHEHVERLPVLVSGFQVEQLLGVPKLPNGTGESTSNAVMAMVQEWGIGNQVKAICFDTTASNTGRKNGACGAIETRLGKNLLYLACRHHINEIVVGDVFKHCFGPSSGPEISLFKRFQEYWPNIDRSQFQTAMDDPVCVEAISKLENLKDDVVTFAKEILQSSQLTRDDYRELLELTILFLGDTPSRGVRFMTPGAMHRARWMAKLLYSVKIWMFKQQFKLTNHEEASLRDMSLFGCLLYTKAWTLCPIPASAPANDLKFLKLVHSYEKVNKGISTAAVKAFLRHLWYLSEELIALAFFDDAVDSNTKRRMITALQKETSDEAQPLKRIQIEPISIPEIELSDFVTSRTTSFFHTLGLNADFLLQADPDNWQFCEHFQMAKKYISSLAVVNDRAERAVKLMQDFNCSITTNEEQKQYLLQVVLSHRAKYPAARKSLLLGVKDDIQQ
jgi:hypothetical protein